MLSTFSPQDINDNAPSFPSSIVDAVVPLDAPIGANVTTVMATDPDDDLNAEIRLGVLMLFINFNMLQLHSRW